MSSIVSVVENQNERRTMIEDQKVVRCVVY